MNTEYVLGYYKKLKEKAKKRNFNQRVEVVITLKDINLQKPENHLEFYVSLPNKIGKDPRICCISDPSIMEESKNLFTTVLSVEQLKKMDKKKAKSIARTHDWFISSAGVMPLVAKSLGKALGPLGKMPSPKAGTVITGKPNLGALKQKLNTLIKVVVKKQNAIQSAVASESMDEKSIAQNIAEFYNQVIKKLPREEKNVKACYIKLTMSKPLKIYPGVTNAQ